MKEFKDVLVGECFLINGIKFTKVKEERISCCKSMNAIASENPANRIFVQGTKQVEEAPNT